jgi:alkylation response protein AidB-like acyl-CoA dehydrogenase
MNFDLDNFQQKIKKDLAGLLKEEGPGLINLSNRDPQRLGQGVRGLLQKLSRGSLYLQSGLDPQEARSSAFAQLLNTVFLGEELARLSASLFISLESSTRLFGYLVARYGDDNQVRAFLDPLRRGELVGALATSESSANFQEKTIMTSAIREGDWCRITGIKRQVVNAPIADYLAVTGLLEGQSAVFLVKPGQEGLTLGEPQKTLGAHGLVQSEVTLNHCPIPLKQVLGPWDNHRAFSEIHTRQNLIYTTASLGIMDRALKASKQYAGESRDGDKPPQAYQEIRFKLAELFTLFQASQWMLYRAAWMLEARTQEAETVAAAAKVFITEAAEEVARGALQIMGPEGYLAGHDGEECFRDARLGPVAGESSEVLRMRIAEDCLARN